MDDPGPGKGKRKASPRPAHLPEEGEGACAGNQYGLSGPDVPHATTRLSGMVYGPRGLENVVGGASEQEDASAPGSLPPPSKKAKHTGRRTAAGTSGALNETSFVPHTDYQRFDPSLNIGVPASAAPASINPASITPGRTAHHATEVGGPPQSPVAPRRATPLYGVARQVASPVAVLAVGPRRPVYEIPAHVSATHPQDPMPNYFQGTVANFPRGPMPNYFQGTVANYPRGTMPNLPQGPIQTYPQGPLPIYPQGMQDYPRGPVPTYPQGPIPHFSSAPAPTYSSRPATAYATITTLTTAPVIAPTTAPTTAPATAPVATPTAARTPARTTARTTAPKRKVLPSAKSATIPHQYPPYQPPH